MRAARLSLVPVLAVLSLAAQASAIAQREVAHG